MAVDFDGIRTFLDRDLTELKREWNNAHRYLQRGEFERLWDVFRRLAFSFNRLGHLPEPSHLGGLTLNLRELGEKLRALTSYQTYFVLTGNPDPVCRLGKPMEEVLSIANRVEMLTRDRSS